MSFATTDLAVRPAREPRKQCRTGEAPRPAYLAAGQLSLAGQPANGLGVEVHQGRDVVDVQDVLVRRHQVLPRQAARLGHFLLPCPRLLPSPDTVPRAYARTEHHDATDSQSGNARLYAFLMALLLLILQPLLLVAVTVAA